MSNAIILPECDANLLRRQILVLQKLRDDFLNQYHDKTVHDLRVASRRFTEMLRYIGKQLPAKWSPRLIKLSNNINARLSRTREIETNIRLLHDFHSRDKAHSIAVELLLNKQNEQLNKARKIAEQCLSTRRFGQYQEFVSNLKGSRSLSPVRSDLVEIRIKEFLAYPWTVTPNDKKLHELRIRARNLGYAIEIKQKISRTKQGLLLSRIRKLQELLGQVHDLFRFQKAVRRLSRDWNVPDLKLVPSLLSQLSQNIFEEKSSLFIRVYPLFARIVPVLTASLPPMSGMPVRSSFSLKENPDKSHSRKRRRLKRLA